MTRGEIAFAVEDSFRTLPGAPVWRQPGENIEATPNLDNSLERARQPDNNQSDGSMEGRFVGTLDLSFDMTDTNFHDMVFPESSNTALPSGTIAWPTVTWYLSADVPGAEQERFLSGSAPTSVTWNWGSDGSVSVDLSMRYSDEPEVGGTHGSAPSSISQPAKADVARWHDSDFQFDGATVSNIQQGTVTIGDLTDWRYGQDRHPTGVYSRPTNISANIQADIADNTFLAAAYGSSTATEPEDVIDETGATFAVDNAAGNIATYTLTKLQPTTYDWQDLFTETFITDPTEFHVSDISVA